MKKQLMLLSLFLGMSLAQTVSASEDVNTLTIQSVGADNKPVLGFKYEVINKDNNDVYNIDLSQINSKAVELPDGQYIVREIARPEGYEQVDDYEITLPYQNQENPGTFHKEVKFSTKHKLAQEKEPEQKEKPVQKIISTSDDSSVKGKEKGMMAAGALVVSGGLLFLILKNKGGKDEQ